MSDSVEHIEISLAVEAIHQRYGYDFSNYSRASLVRRFRHFLARTGYHCVGETIPILLRDERLFVSLLGDLSITVTEMFRDPLSFLSLRERVVPYLKTYPFVRIWCAGCATGEEVYSLAIMLAEEGILDKALIYATDFNEEALETARRGVYSGESIKAATGNYQKSGGANPFSDYFHAKAEGVEMAAGLRSKIAFASHNLVTDKVFGEMNLIMCRNVLIYFDKTLQDRVLQLFSDSLHAFGYLALGSKESLQFSSVAETFMPVDPHWKLFQKKTLDSEADR